MVMSATGFLSSSLAWVVNCCRNFTSRSLLPSLRWRSAFQPALFTALAILTEVKRLHPSQFRIENDGFTQMLGSRWARAAFDRGEDPRVIQRRWQQEEGGYGQKSFGDIPSDDNLSALRSDQQTPVIPSESRDPYASRSTPTGHVHAADALRDLIDMGDAPSCHVCGAIMTRNGSCFRCMSCGSTSGCS